MVPLSSWSTCIFTKRGGIWTTTHLIIWLCELIRRPLKWAAFLTTVQCFSRVTYCDVFVWRQLSEGLQRTAVWERRLLQLLPQRRQLLSDGQRQGYMRVSRSLPHFPVISGRWQTDDLPTPCRPVHLRARSLYLSCVVGTCLSGVFPVALPSFSLVYLSSALSFIVSPNFILCSTIKTNTEANILWMVGITGNVEFDWSS